MGLHLKVEVNLPCTVAYTRTVVIIQDKKFTVE